MNDVSVKWYEQPLADLFRSIIPPPPTRTGLGKILKEWVDNRAEGETFDIIKIIRSHKIVELLDEPVQKYIALSKSIMKFSIASANNTIDYDEFIRLYGNYSPNEIESAIEKRIKQSKKRK